MQDFAHDQLTKINTHKYIKDQQKHVGPYRYAKKEIKGKRSRAPNTLWAFDHNQSMNSMSLGNILVKSSWGSKNSMNTAWFQDGSFNEYMKHIYLANRRSCLSSLPNVFGTLGMHINRIAPFQELTIWSFSSFTNNLNGNLENKIRSMISENYCMTPHKNMQTITFIISICLLNGPTSKHIPRCKVNNY